MIYDLEQYGQSFLPSPEYISRYNNGSGYMEEFGAFSTLAEAESSWSDVLASVAFGSTDVDVLYKGKIISKGTV